MTIKWVGALAIMCMASSAWAQNADPARVVHLRHTPTLVCASETALIELSRPNARQVLGDINYMSYVARGDCHEIDNRLPLLIGPIGTRISGVFQFRPGTTFVTRMYFAFNRDLVGHDGEPPHR